jgi:hypothetical protein
MCEIFCVRGPCATGEQTFGVALYVRTLVRIETHKSSLMLRFKDIFLIPQLLHVISIKPSYYGILLISN